MEMAGPDTAGGRNSVALVGNPNVGKSVIFGFLTGHYATVSNYPGTTVEVIRGQGGAPGRELEFIDTPGVASLVPMSEDEQVTRNILLFESPGSVILVADARNLGRALQLAMQLADMELPFLLDLNLVDEAGERGIRIDADALSRLLGVPVVSTVAVRRSGLERLRRRIADAALCRLSLRFDSSIESAVTDLVTLLPQSVPTRSLALMLLAGDRSLYPWLARRLSRERLEEIERIRRRLQERYPEPLGAVFAMQRMHALTGILDQVVHKEAMGEASWRTALGRWTMHPLGGVIIGLGILFLLWVLVGKIGAGLLVDLIEGTLFAHLINPWAVRMAGWLPWSLARDFLVGQYGLVTMALTYAFAIILPIVGTFFLAFGVLEDSGYLPRLAVMMDRALRRVGLNGKAVLPMVLGLGCGTMAVLTSRILETRKERLLVTFLLALAVPCSAQLGVVMGMLGALPLAAALWWLGTIFLVLLLVGSLAARVMPGESSDFILELPPLRVPRIENILMKTLGRIEWYLREAVPLFILGTAILFILDRLGWLGALQSALSPVVVGWLGLPAQVTQAFLVGFLRRDYGAAGIYELARQGLMNPVQIVVSLVTITLFIPCIAQFLVTIKERGWPAALLMLAFIMPFAILVGGLLGRLMLIIRIGL